MTPPLQSHEFENQGCGKSSFDFCLLQRWEECIQRSIHILCLVFNYGIRIQRLENETIASLNGRIRLEARPPSDVHHLAALAAEGVLKARHDMAPRSCPGRS